MARGQMQREAMWAPLLLLLREVPQLLLLL